MDPANGAAIGGLVGFGGLVTSSYFDFEVAGTMNSSGGEPKSTAEMGDIGTYLGWDFGGDVWSSPIIDYPSLVNNPHQ